MQRRRIGARSPRAHDAGESFGPDADRRDNHRPRPHPDVADGQTVRISCSFSAATASSVLM